MTDLSILYRGPLVSCNYACGYCPFAKRRESPVELAHDRECLDRFVDWCESQTDRTLGVLFTPWGEALVRRWYRDALARLTRMAHVRKAAVQTNLSCGLGWVEECDKAKLALWCTYHPAETTRDKFLDKCRELVDRGVRFSVGVVGLRDHLAEIAAVRAALPADVYLWVNAYKRDPDYYTPDMADALTAIDPHFPTNNRYHASRGEPCRAGASVIAVDGDGTVRRCHFVKEPIGNLYAPEFADGLRERACPNESCGCHIGYAHLDRLGLSRVYGDGILERIPLGFR